MLNLYYPFWTYRHIERKTENKQKSNIYLRACKIIGYLLSDTMYHLDSKYDIKESIFYKQKIGYQL